MKSDDRLFWVAFVLGMVLLKVVAGLGLLHRLLPAYFDPPGMVCERGVKAFAPELADSEPKHPAALAHQAQVAINTEAKEAAHA